MQQTEGGTNLLYLIEVIVILGKKSTILNSNQKELKYDSTWSLKRTSGNWIGMCS